MWPSGRKYGIGSLSGRSDAWNIPFNQGSSDTTAEAKLGFSERIKGSHHTFTRDDSYRTLLLYQSRVKGRSNG